MSDSTNTLALGLQYHRAGNLSQAEHIYRQVLQNDSANALALGYLADVCMAQGRFAEAAANFQQVLQLTPPSASTYNDLGVAFAQLGKVEEAVASFRQALQLKPNADAHNNLGIMLVQQGKLEEAITSYARALQLRPNYPEAHNNLGIVFTRRRELAVATEHYQEALRLRPDYAAAHNNLGLALAEQGQWDAAIASYRQALQLQPNYVDAHYNLALAFAGAHQTDLASACYQEVLGLKPDYAEAYNNLGVELLKQGRLEDCAASLRQALRLKSDYAEAHYNLGLVLVKELKLDEAIASFQQALRLKYDYAEAHKDLGLAWLLEGNFEQGWPEYEWRWQCPHIAPPPLPRPLWDGTPLAGRTILLHAEQGLGDTLQFIRYAPLVQQRGGKIAVLCQPQLLSLLASCPGIDRVVPQGEALPNADLHASLPSLPRIFGATLATIPAQVPYLSADAQFVERWRRELDSLCLQRAEERGRFRVGIAWQGNPKHKQDQQRSVPLARFEALARLPGLELFSLQVGSGAEQVRGLFDRFSITDLGSRFDPGSFQDAAAVVTVLDLVITVDSAIAHLAGALGFPVWVLLPYVPDWRWLLGREDSPWYPTMRLFRQQEPGAWDPVFSRVLDALRKRLLDEPRHV